MIQTVIDHLWQSTLFAGAAGLLTLAFRHNRANFRFCLWLAASMKFLIPFSLLLWAGRQLRWDHAVTHLSAGEWTGYVDRFTQPATTLIAAAPSTANPMPATPVTAIPVPAESASWDLHQLLLAVWACGLALMLIRWTLQWLMIKGALKAGSRLDIAAPLPVISAPSFHEPGLFGIVRPVIVLPREISQHLAPSQLAAIIDHEVCHWRRRDNLTAVLHMAVMALFWFYPLVWWIGARLIAERENACDEKVIQAGGDRQTYAEGILKICQFYVGRGPLCVPGVSGGDLKKRIESIMTSRLPLKLPLAKKILLVSAACLALAGPVAIGLAFSLEAVAQSAKIVDPAVEYQRLIDQRRFEQSKPRTEISVDPNILDRYVGYYRIWNIVYSVTRDGNRLFGQMSGESRDAAPVEIFAESNTDFFYKSRMAQLTFTVDGQGNATKLTTHQGGYDQIARRIGEAEAKSFPDQLERKIRENQQQPGTEAALRRYYEGLAVAKFDFDDIGESKAKNMREQQAVTEFNSGRWGALQSITFLGVDSRGWEMYRIKYDGAELEQSVSFTPEGKIDGTGGIADPSALRKEVKLDEKALPLYTGTYTLAGSNFTVENNGGRLFVKYPGQKSFEIFAGGERVFFIKNSPVQYSFVTNGQDKASALIMHGGGRDQTAKRVTDADAKAAEERLARHIAENKPLPKSEQALRHAIEDRQKGRPNYGTMGPELADIVRIQLPGVQKELVDLGKLKSLEFRGVSPAGFDIYNAHFANGDQEWQILMSSDGIIRALSHHLLS